MGGLRLRARDALAQGSLVGRRPDRARIEQIVNTEIVSETTVPFDASGRASATLTAPSIRSRRICRRQPQLGQS